MKNKIIKIEVIGKGRHRNAYKHTYTYITSLFYVTAKYCRVWNEYCEHFLMRSTPHTTTTTKIHETNRQFEKTYQ